MNDIDTDLFGLQYELVDFLGDRGLVVYDDFRAVEVDVGNAEIVVSGLSVPWGGALESALRLFAAQRVFPVIFYDAETSSVHLRRRVE